MILDMSELRSKREKDLQKLLEKTKEGFRKNVIEVMQGKSKDTSKFRQVRRNVARILTVINERKISKEEK